VDQYIVFEEKVVTGGRIGFIILNRPQALNALTYDMLVVLTQKMTQWQGDDTILAVIIKSSSERAFCAGGDIRSLYKYRHLRFNQPHPFFSVEYEFNRFLYHFKKPYVAFCNGMTMGGGVGISIHGSHRIASDSMVWAMPETKIGFFPDVGVSYYLAKCPDFVGYYLALSGHSIDAETARLLGLVDFIVPDQSWALCEEKIVSADLTHAPFKKISRILSSCQSVESLSGLQEYFPLINRCFSLNSLPAIFNALELEDCDWGKQLLVDLYQRAPLSLKITYQQLNRVVGMSLDEVMAQDTGLVHHFLQGHDFYEGARALIVDKDNTPLWKPERMDQVTETMVEHYFQ
jgi:enoyl-CoA hydratase